MLLKTLLLSAMLTTSPKAAVRVAAAAADAEWVVPFLDRVAEIESRGQPIGLHPNDMRFGKGAYRRAVKVGWLSPVWCAGHREHRRGWSPRGPWGVAPAYSHRHLGPLGCERGPELHDVPLYAAVAAVGHVLYLARKYDTRDAMELRLLWAGREKSRRGVEARWRGKRPRS